MQLMPKWKLCIIKAHSSNLLNKRDEMISKCRHENKFYIKNYKNEVTWDQYHWQRRLTVQEELDRQYFNKNFNIHIHLILSKVLPRFLSNFLSIFQLPLFFPNLIYISISYIYWALTLPLYCLIVHTCTWNSK